MLSGVAIAPALGFGGGSMGSRKSEKESLAALRHAHEAGIRWFDVAPSYGDGAAEVVLGRFLREVGGDAVVCTKVGILPGKVSLAKRLARPLLRTVLELAPGARGAVKRVRPAARKQQLTGQLIMASLEESLRRLDVDRVDVLALHDATPAEVVREDVLEALDNAVASGKASQIGIASSPDAAIAGLRASDIFGMVQFAHNPCSTGLSSVVNAIGERPVKLVTHSVFGSAGLVDKLATRIENDGDLRTIMQQAGYQRDPRAMARDFLLDFAFANGRSDVVVMSMISRDHREYNLRRHKMSGALDRAVIESIAERVELREIG